MCNNLNTFYRITKKNNRKMQQAKPFSFSVSHQGSPQWLTCLHLTLSLSLASSSVTLTLYLPSFTTSTNYLCAHPDANLPHFSVFPSGTIATVKNITTGHLNIRLRSQMTPLAHLKFNKMKAKSIINQYKHTNDYFFD